MWQKTMDMRVFCLKTSHRAKSLRKQKLLDDAECTETGVPAKI